VKYLREKLWIKSKHTFYIFNNFLIISCRWRHHVERYCKAGQATDGNIALAHCMLHN